MFLGTLVAYADTHAFRTMTLRETRALLRHSGATSAHYRDHVLLALPLWTGLRCFEALGLDCADVYNRRGGARQRVELRVFKDCGGRAPQFILVPDRARKLLDRYRDWKQRRKQGLGDAPLFVSRHSGRLSRSRAREIFARWRDAAALSPLLSFHSLRHTYCQRLYEQTGDIRLVQRLARHSSIETTTRYTGPSDEQLYAAIREI